MRRAALVIAIAVALAAWGCGPVAPEHRLVRDDGTAVRIPRAEVEDGKVHFFTYPAEDANVDFLVRTDGRGALHVHLDACYSCYHYRRGYTVEDDDLVCVACRLEYPIADEVWDLIGACAPIPIHSSLDAESVVIERSILLKAARYF